MAPLHDLATGQLVVASPNQLRACHSGVSYATLSHQCRGPVPGPAVCQVYIVSNAVTYRGLLSDLMTLPPANHIPHPTPKLVDGAPPLNAGFSEREQEPHLPLVPQRFYGDRSRCDRKTDAQSKPGEGAYHYKANLQADVHSGYEHAWIDNHIPGRWLTHERNGHGLG